MLKEYFTHLDNALSYITRLAWRDAFKCPRDFDPERKANRHFTLASGAHLCLGAHLARQEIKIALEHWLRRVPMFSVAEGDELIVVPSLMSVTHLQIVW